MLNYLRNCKFLIDEKNILRGLGFDDGLLASTKCGN